MTDHPAQSDRPRRTRNIPPLAWIVVAMLVAWIVGFALSRDRTHVTPHGGTMPSADPGTSYMRPVPASPGAPGTPGGVGPNSTAAQ